VFTSCIDTISRVSCLTVPLVLYIKVVLVVELVGAGLLDARSLIVLGRGLLAT
jgi:hypothetical protein